MADPGYELGIQFTLMTDPALKKLDEFSQQVEAVVGNLGNVAVQLQVKGTDQLTNLESRIDEISSEPVTLNFAKQAAEAEQAAAPPPDTGDLGGGVQLSGLVEATKQTDNLTKSVSTLEEAFSALKEDTSDQRRDLEGIRKEMGKYDLAIESLIETENAIAQTMRTSQGQYDTQLASIQKLRLIRSSIQKQIDDLVLGEKALNAEQNTALEALKERLKELDELDKRTDEELKAQEQKLKLTKQVTSAQQFLSKALTSGQKEFGAITEGVNKFVTSGNVLHALLPVLEIAFLDLVAAQDAYAKANFRAAGSVNELMNINTDLQGSLALTSGDAAKVAKAAADAGIRSEEEFGKAARSISQFATVTGASTDAVADFSKKALIAFKTTGDFAQANEDLRQVLGGMVNAMKAGGLSSADMNKVLTQTSKKLLVVRGAFGAAAAADYAAAMSSAAATAKALGLEADDLTKILQDLTDPVGALNSDFMLLFARSGQLQGVLSGSTSPAEAYAASMGQLSQDIEDVVKSTDNAFAQQIKLSAMTGMSEQQAARMIASFKEQGGSADAWLAKQKEMEKAAKKKADLDKQWQEATDTLKMALMKALMPLIALIEKGMVPLIEALTWVASSTQYVIDAFNSMDAGTKAMIGTVGKVAAVAIAAVVGFKVLTAVVGPVIGLFAGIFKMGKLAATGLGVASKSMSAAATGATSLGKAATPTIGKQIASFFGGLAHGMAKLANPKVVLGIGIAIVSLGALSFILVMTAKQLKGFEVAALVATVAIIGMAFAFSIMAPALVTLGTAGTIAIPILLALSVVMLAVGAAVMMAAGGIALIVEAGAQMVDSFANLFSVLTFENVAAFGLMAIGIGALAISMVSVPIIAIGLAGLAAAFIAAWGASKTLNRIIPGLTALSKTGPGLHQVGEGMMLLAMGMTNLANAPKSVDARLRQIHEITTSAEPLAPVKFAQMLTSRLDDESREREREKVAILSTIAESLINILTTVNEGAGESILSELRTHLPEIADKLDDKAGLSSAIKQWV